MIEGRFEKNEPRNVGQGAKVLFFLEQLGTEGRFSFKQWLNRSKPKGNRQFVDILKWLEKNHFGDNLSGFSYEALSKLILPERVLDHEKRKYIGTRLAHLQKALYEYLSLLGWQSKPFLKQLHLIQWAVEVDVGKYMPRLFERTFQFVHEKSGADEITNQLAVRIVQNSYLSDRSTDPDTSKLDELEKALDTYLILQKLKYGCARLVEEVLGGKRVRDPLIQNMLDVWEHHLLKKPRIVQAYFFAYKMFFFHQKGDLQESETCFRRFLICFYSLLEEQQTDALDLFIYGQNYCILGIREGLPKYRESFADLYAGSFESNLFGESKTMHCLLYKNCIETLCKNNQIEEAEKIAVDLRDKIPREVRNIAFEYNMAVINFYKGNFDCTAKVMYWSQGDFHKIAYGQGARVYHCRSLFEMGELETLLHALHAFSQYLLRHRKRLQSDLPRYRKFIKYLRQITKALLDSEDKVMPTLQRIQSEIDFKEPYNSYLWLRLKIKTILSQIS